MTRLLRILALVCLATLLCAQQTTRRTLAFYTATVDTSLSGTAEVVTIQQPASNSRTVNLQAATIYCSADCWITQERDGSAASATAVTSARLNREAPAPAALVYRSSDVGTGTVLAKFKVPADVTAAIDLKDIVLSGDGTDRNYTFRTDAITGRVVIVLKWQEQ